MTTLAENQIRSPMLDNQSDNISNSSTESSKHKRRKLINSPRFVDHQGSNMKYSDGLDRNPLTVKL